MAKVLLSLLLFATIFSSQARTKYEFSLIPVDQSLDKQINYYLEFLESSISSGIRLGTNKPIKIEFKHFGNNPLELNCNEEYLREISTPIYGGNTIFLNIDIYLQIFLIDDINCKL